MKPLKRENKYDMDFRTIFVSTGKMIADVAMLREIRYNMRQGESGIALAAFMALEISLAECLKLVKYFWLNDMTWAMKSKNEHILTANHDVKELSDFVNEMKNRIGKPLSPEDICCITSSYMFWANGCSHIRSAIQPKN